MNNLLSGRHKANNKAKYTNLYYFFWRFAVMRKRSFKMASKCCLATSCFLKKLFLVDCKNVEEKNTISFKG